MRLKFLLRPGWIALILLVAAFSTVCFTLLAPWQFGRDQETRTRNAAIQQSLHADPQPLGEVLPGGQAPGPGTEWTQVSFHGHYLPEGETLGWLRTVQGEAAIEVLTPFRLDNGQTLLVDRGYVRPVNGTEAPEFPPAPTGPVDLTARVRADENDSENRPAFTRDGRLWSYSVDSKTIGDGTGIPMRPGYFSLSGGQPGALAPLPLPALQTGPYFSYALQWITFGVMAPLAVGYLVYAETRPSQLPERTGGQPAQAGPQPGHRPMPARESTGQPKAQRKRRRRMSVAEAVAEDERREREEASNNG